MYRFPDNIAFSAFTIVTQFPCSNSFETCEHILPTMQFVASTTTNFFCGFNSCLANYTHTCTIRMVFYQVIECNNLPSRINYLLCSGFRNEKSANCQSMSYCSCSQYLTRNY